MSVLVQGTRILVLVAVICGATCADANPSGSPRTLDAHGAEGPGDQGISENKLESHALSRVGVLPSSLTGHNQQHTRLFPEPFAPQAIIALPNEASEVSANWAELQSRILTEAKTLAACRSGDGPCSAAARRFLSIIELGRQRQGRARLGEINRAVNLGIKPVSDWAQYSVDDFWSAPLATLSVGAGDCEDYAIAKYVALRESGIGPDDLRLVIVRDVKRKTNHAVIAVRHDEQWLILDNRTLIMANAEEARHYFPLFVLDHRGVRTFGMVGFRR